MIPSPNTMKKQQKTICIRIEDVYGTIEDLIKELSNLKREHGNGTINLFNEHIYGDDFSVLEFSYERDETEQECIDRKNIAKKNKSHRKANYENLKKEFESES